MGKIKILQINKLYFPWIGGIESVVRDTAETLNGSTDMTVLVCRDQGRGVTEGINGVKVVRAGSMGIKFSMPLSFTFPFLVKKYAADADVIILHDPFPLGDLAVLLSGIRGKVVVWWHSDIIRQKKMLKLISPMIHRLLRRADVIFTATEGHINGSSFLPEYREKCRIVPYWIDTKKYLSAKRCPFLTERLNDKNSVKLLFAGRLVYYKGTDILLEAMKSVKGAELFMVGAGADEKSIKKYADDNCLNGKVHFIPPLSDSDLKAAFGDCDIFVFPSTEKSEAFGIVQLEAMVYGKPVINTRLGTGAEHVSIDGVTGITVQPKDPVELSRAIMRLVSDPDVRRLMGERAAARVKEEFDIKVNSERVYREINMLSGKER